MNMMAVNAAVEHVRSMLAKGREFEPAFARVCAGLRLDPEEKRRARELLKEDA